MYGGIHFSPGRPDPDNITRMDLNCMPMVHDMHWHGIRIDVPYLRTMSMEISDRQRDIENEVSLAIGNYQYSHGKHGLMPFAIGSRDHLAQLFFEHLKIQGDVPVPLTPKGKRFEVSEEILKPFTNAHPAVPLVMEWHSINKIKTTYTDTLPLMVDSDSRLHTTFNMTVAATGRLSSSNPNLQNIPIRTKLGKRVRAAFIAGKGKVLTSNDLCLHPETLVDTVYGPRQISSISPGDKVLTLRGDYIKFGIVTRSVPIVHLPAYKLTFDNGESVISSSDHKWPVNLQPRLGKGWRTFIRKEKTTRELVIGEHMVPCKTGSGGLDRRGTWYSKGARWYTKKHILIAEAIYGPRPCGYDVHHKDGDSQNNDPNNLEYKLHRRHLSDHNKENYKKQDHTLRLKRLREGIKNRRPYFGSANPNAKLKDGDRDKIFELRLRGCSVSWLAEQFGVTKEHITNIVCKQKNKSKLENHRLVKKEFLGFQPMHAITVEPDHNYVLSCGVVTFNSQIEMVWAAHRSQDPVMMDIFRQGHDIHTRTACGVYGLDYDHCMMLMALAEAKTATPAQVEEYAYFKQFQRLPCKTVGFGILYGQTPEGLSDSLAGEGVFWSAEDCTRFVEDSFFGVYTKLKAMLEADWAFVQRYGMICCDFGRPRLVPEAKSALRRLANEGIRKAGNHPEQASAQGTIKVGMAAVTPIYRKLNTQGINVWPLLQIHDDLMHEVDADFAKEYGQMVQYEMENATPLTVPTRSSCNIAERWIEL